MNIKRTKVAWAVGTSLLTVLLVGVIVLQSRDYQPAETAGAAQGRSVPSASLRPGIGVAQETVGRDAVRPPASPPLNPSEESLPGSDDFYWPPVLENYHANQTETTIDVQQEAGSWDAIKPPASPPVKPAMESLSGSEEGVRVFTEDGPYACLALEEFADKLKRPNHDVILIERLEHRIDCLLAEAAQNPSLITPKLNREIERLDSQIDMLQLAGMVDR